MRFFVPSILLAALAVQPAEAQDILQPIEDLVERVIPQPTPAPAPPPRPPEPEPTATQSTDPDEVAPLPRPRPDPPETVPETAEEQDDPTGTPEPVGTDRVYQSACPAVLAGLVEAEALPPLSEGACGERSPLSITGVLVRGSMVPLSNPVVTNCAMAGSLPDWVETVDGYAASALGSGVAAVTVGTGYMCRNRNGAEGGFTSEHGFANALDVVGFTLADGRSITVEADWLPAPAPEGRLLRLAHDAACGRFTTVLGPEANAEHADHLHLDLGCHGESCTARICE